MYSLYNCFSDVQSSAFEDDDEKCRVLFVSQNAHVQEAFDLKNTAAKLIADLTLSGQKTSDF